MLGIGFDSSGDIGDEEVDDDERIRAEISIIKSLLSVVSDGSPLVRAEVAVGKRFSLSHIWSFCGLMACSMEFGSFVMHCTKDTSKMN